MAVLTLDVDPDTIGVGSWSNMDNNGVTTGTVVQMVAGDATINVRMSRPAALALSALLVKEPDDG